MQLIVEGVGNHDSNAFSALLDNDQLTPCLATSATFPGFQELTLPSFAPTYKRKVIHSLSLFIYRRMKKEILKVTQIFKLYPIVMIMK